MSIDEKHCIRDCSDTYTLTRIHTHTHTHSVYEYRCKELHKRLLSVEAEAATYADSLAEVHQVLKVYICVCGGMFIFVYVYE